LTGSHWFQLFFFLDKLINKNFLLSPESFKWKLLHIYLEKYSDVVYYKAVCKRLLTLGYEVPSYIINSFKKVNSNALLQLFINFGLLEEAYDLCIDYMDALMTSRGIGRFDIKV
jgi:hypothetical protein